MLRPRTTPQNGLLATLLLAAAILLTGCVQSIADRMATAPNARYSTEQVRALSLEPEAPGTVIDQALRIPVDPRGKDDAAEIAVWIVEPTDEKLELAYRGTALRALTPTSDQPVAARGTVVLLHGLWHHKGQRVYTLWARLFAANGYRCVLMDLRGHGQSTGTLVSYGVHEAADTRQVLDALEQRGLIDRPLTLMGGSMGAATAIQAAAQDDRVDSVVCLAPYSSLDDAIESAAEAIYLLAFLMPGGFWDDYTQAVCDRNAITPDQTDNIAAAQQMNVPMLLIGAGDDKLIPPDQARALHRAAPPGSQLHIAQGQNHRSIARGVSPELLDLVMDWLAEVQTPAATATNQPHTPHRR